MNETDPYFVRIKEEHEPIVEKISVYNNDFSLSHGKHLVEVSNISEIESNEDDFTIDAKSLLNYVKCENEDEKKKENVSKVEIELEHVVMKEDDFQVPSDRTVDTYTIKSIESIEDLREDKLQIVTKSEPDIYDVSNLDCYDELDMQKLMKSQKLNTSESMCIVKKEAEIKKEEHDPLQYVQEEEYGYLEETVLVTSEVVEGVDETDSHQAYAADNTRLPTDSDLKCNKLKQQLQKKFLCQKYGKSFARKSHLTEHERRERQPQNRFSCQSCGKSYARKINLTEHERIHTDERPFECTLCDEKFINKTYLNRHQRVHISELWHECQFCNKRFLQKTVFKQHVAAHTQGRKFSCEKCGMSFLMNKHLKEHQLVHTNERAFQCEFCYKRFKQKHNLKIHERIHTNERPFECHFCSKRFMHKHILKMHEAAHMKESKFSCDKCGELCMCKDNPTKYERLCNKKCSFLCQFCGREFSTKHGLEKHEVSHGRGHPVCQYCGVNHSQRVSRKAQMHLQ